MRKPRQAPLGLDHLSPAHSELCTYAGGILSNILQPKRPPHSYFAELQGEHPHWKPCGMVFTSPVYVIQEEELDSLESGSASLSENSPLMDTLNRRADSQMERTIAHPRMPAKYEGQPYHHIVGPGLENREAKDAGAPMSVHGEPVVFSVESSGGTSPAQPCCPLPKPSTAPTPDWCPWSPHLPREAMPYPTGPSTV